MRQIGTNQAPPEGNAETLAFAGFLLDRRAGRLTRAGESIPLRPKTWAVLLYLAERPGVLITKDELLDAVWADVAVTPDTLTKSIGELRTALKDDSKTPRYIETVHRRGFRFIAQPLHEPAIGPPLEWPAPSQQHFVGRTAELQRLDALLAKAATGERQMIFVTGQAGVGKTALVEAFLSRLETGVRTPAPSLQSLAPVLIARGACLEQHGTREAYMPILEALERLAHRPDADTFVGLLRRGAPTWLAQMPWLIGDDDARALHNSLQTARTERMLRELAGLLEALTTDVTLVLALEDLHWSDWSTVDALSLLGQRREPARLLVIATYRPAEVAVQEHVLSHAVHTLQLHRRCVELPLHELTLEDVQSYLERCFAGAQFPPALAQMLYRHTDGNPLFVTAVVDNLRARGFILDTAPGWALSTTLEKIELGVPQDARRMIEMQFEGLTPADRQLLETGSVSGVEFAPQAIAAALGVDVGETEMRCERLARAHRFLRASGNTEWPDGTVARRYAFTHELYRQAVYEEIPEGQRLRLHARIGEALETAYGERAREIAAPLAMHFERGRDHARTVQYLAAAGAQARQRFANREAIAYLEGALAATTRLKDKGERRRRELELRIALAPALSDLHGFASDPARQNCERARDLCAEVGSPDQSFQVLYALCHIYSVRADEALLPQTEANLDNLARHLRSPEYHLLADTILVRTAMQQGRFADACRLAEERLPSLQGEETMHPSFAYGADPVIGAHCMYAHALWFLGHPERAGTTMQASVAAARVRGSLFTQTAALFHACLLELFCRNSEAVGELVEQALALSGEQGFAYWHAMALGLRGWAWAQHDRIEEGISELQGALTALRATDARLFSTHILAFLAEAHLRARNHDAGLAAVEEGLAVAESTLDRTYWPELWRLKGELLLRSSSPATSPSARQRRGSGRTTASDPHWQEAEQCLLRALELARNSEARSLELRAATSLARAWRARGRTVDARSILAGICEWFGSSPDNRDLVEARTMLDELPPARTALS